jgi:hypothetical protein
MKLGGRLNLLAEALLFPIAAIQPLDPQEYRLSERLEQILEDEKWVFRTAGPPWFLVLMRIFFGMLNAAKVLNIRIQIGEVLQLYLPSQFSAMQAALSLSEARRVLRPKLDGVDSARPAEFLFVEVHRGREMIVSLQMPATAVENLHELVPESTADEMSRRGQDLRQIGQNAMMSGLQPQELFKENTGEKSYRVWLA